MIPTLASIVEMLIAGECDAQRGLALLNQHMENADLRDHFAGLAMQGQIIAIEGLVSGSKTAMLQISATCYQMADTMLEARK